MKRTKLFLIATMLVCSMGAWAQDSYREAFDAYLSNNPSAGNWGDVGSNLKPAFEMINKTVLKHYTEATSNALIEEYLTKQFGEDVKTNMMLPSFRKHVTEAELRELNEAMKTPKGKEFILANDKLTNGLTSNTEFVAQMMKVGMQIGMGETPTAIEPSKEIPASYIALWDKYYQESESAALIESMLSLQQQAADQQTDKEVLEKIKLFMKDNFNVLFMNVSYKNMPEDVLKYGVELASKPCFKHTMTAMRDMMSGDMQQLGMKFIEAYAIWLEAKGVEIKDGL